jgi:hypothetical protein
MPIVSAAVHLAAGDDVDTGDFLLDDRRLRSAAAAPDPSVA